jgi:hypothetical protein
MDKFTAVADVVRDFPGDSNEEVFDQGLTIGKALGSSIRIVFNF